jgi:HPt (histidine-containing phosphotransfer) domain-containing protein
VAVGGERHPEAEAAIAALRIDYLVGLPPKLDELAREVRGARAESARASLEQAYRCAHRLYGSAGAYGLAALAEPLGKIETALYDVLEAGACADEPWWRAVEAQLAETLDAGAVYVSRGLAGRGEADGAG